MEAKQNKPAFSAAGFDRERGEPQQTPNDRTTYYSSYLVFCVGRSSGGKICSALALRCTHGVTVAVEGGGEAGRRV